MEKKLKFEKVTDPDAIRNIESKSFFDNTENVDFEHKETLEALFGLLKEGIVKLRVRHNKEKDLWVAEIYFVDTGGIWYHTDDSDEVTKLMDVVIKNGYEPEYIEE